MKLTKVTIGNLKQHYKEHNPDGHFFSRNTTRSFNSKIHEAYYDEDTGDTLFITSEQFDSLPRSFTVRKVLDRADAGIAEVSEFQEFSTLAEARQFLKESE